MILGFRTCSFALLISVLAAAFSGCQKNRSGPEVRIGIAQYLNHPSLDETRSGFMEEMARLGYSRESGTEFDYQNASGDMSTAQSIAQKFATGRYSLIFSIATPMTQAVKRATEGKNIPVVFGAITDPISAGLVQTMREPGGNITGTSDQWPYEQQMELIREALPQARRVGVVFNPGEANTRYAMDQTRKAAGKLGLELVEAAISSPNDIVEAIGSIVHKSDVLYIPADNTAMAGATTIVRTADTYHVPVVAGDAGTFNAGCLVGLGVSYKELGVQAARLAVAILKDKKSPGNLPVVVSGKPRLMANLEVARRLGVELPDTIVRRADTVIGK